ncbi:type II toxin-antitoxin system VapC family toxin [Nostoc sp. CHAB 5715]|uniref:type II toxin-antitoxin system VapC family toxin n=1 Tax=Nostoc sp. CHAB 5715 TaxID=2780400 RepID=UPI001E4074EA|nr:type II toxin-antitoxin system VapC family toxin [Nostoc sp. CHAB 5715]MCC5626517.1 type II toxin-antitoxin system VapC family toxin [Nostoc sp. CHAB 5715]
MYLLDTDTLTHLYAGQPNVVERLRSVDDPDVGITIITKGEVLRGRIDYLIKAQTGADLLKAQSLLFRTEELLNQLLIVPVSQTASEQFERLRIVPKLQKIGRADLLIARACFQTRCILKKKRSPCDDDEQRRLKQRTVGEVKTATTTTKTPNG